ncbi:winged helix domain-containing protein [Aquitalea pelogenes]
MLSQIVWNKDTVSDFLGHYLTEPKPHVFYDSPDDELDEDEFANEVSRHGVELDRKSLILFHQEMFYCNGEVLEIEPADVAVWQQFANQRHLSAADIRPSLLGVLYEGYLDGYWHLSPSVAK